jgi:cytochrome P450
MTLTSSVPICPSVGNLSLASWAGECKRSADTRADGETADVVPSVEINGQTVPAGSAMLLFIGSANRDDRRFPDGERFDTHPRTTGHFTFTHGVHFCLGAALARLEGRVALEEILKRFPGREVDTEQTKLGITSTVRGWETALPVVLTS